MVLSVAFKEGVRFDNLTPRMLLGFFACFQVYNERGVPCVITAGCDGKHMKASKHYVGDALDLRLPSRYSNYEDLDHKVVAELKEALGKQFDVVLEGDHIHVEFDPK
jgi:hypothetical protein